MSHTLTDAAVRNGMVVHAAFGGSTNLILHLGQQSRTPPESRPHQA